MRTSFALLIALTIGLAACDPGFFTKTIDGRTDENGDVIILDTQKNWDYWVTLMDLGIQDEAAGKPVSRAWKSWNERWYYSIDAVRRGGRENPDRYINYIIDKRREVGLPPLRRD